MALSRRGFLRTGAALPVAVATGGTGAVTGGVVKAATAGAGIAATFEAAKTMAEKVELAQKILGTKKGGYPFDGINAVFRHIFHRPNAGYGHIDEDYASHIQNVVLGKSDFFRHDSSDKNCPRKHGKIDFSAELRVLARLSDLPGDIPLDVLLSDELHNSVEKSFFNDGYATQEHRRLLREFLGPLMQDGATVQDVKKVLERHVLRLARHAISTPEDFSIGGGYLPDGATSANDVITIDSDIHDILYRVGKIKGDEAQNITAELSRVYKERIESHDKPTIFKEKLEERAERARQEKVRHERFRNDREEKKSKPWLREPRAVDLRDVGQGRFVIQLDGRQQQDILRMDWYHWVESLDPVNKKICDIGLDETGAILTVKNSVALEFLKNALAEKRSTVVTVSLPNSAVGRDLNDRPEFGIFDI